MERYYSRTNGNMPEALVDIQGYRVQDGRHIAKVTTSYGGEFRSFVCALEDLRDHIDAVMAQLDEKEVNRHANEISRNH
ncbi:hypothetical protein [Shouchella clausii]|uniref:hypothetical protein n=1 Tax=Shouchella clausii TaxID=79880 RepID=UPI001652E53A|nr:hypothetical protein [Shouchella clausii]